jgi:hypothetical protein
MDQEKATESISSKTAAWGPYKGETTSDTRAGPMLRKNISRETPLYGLR